MAQTTDDAANTSDASASTSLSDKFAGLKTQFAADENGTQPGAGNEEDDDKTNDNAAEAEDASADDDSSGDDNSNVIEDDAAGAGDEGQESDFRFSQFKGDGTEKSYRENIEKAYLESTQEALRLKDIKEVSDGFERQVNAIKAAAAKDPEFGTKLLSLLNGNGAATGQEAQDAKDLANGASGNSDNPFLKDAEATWNRESEKEAAEFTAANPEVLTDPKVNADVKRWMRVYSNEIFQTEGRLIKAGEAMELAFRHLGYEDKRQKTQSLVDGMKKNAAPARPQPAKKKPASNAGGPKQFSNLTLDIASKMRISKDRLVKGSK